MLDHINIPEARLEDWKIFKFIRLESLRDVPIAYAAHLDDGLAMSDDDWRSKGLGGKILANLEEHARARGIKLMVLAVNMENLRAHRFYRRNGYLHTGILPNACYLNGKYTDEIQMHKLL